MSCVSLISELMFLHCSQSSCGMAVMFERDITTSIWLPCTLSNVPITTRSTYKYIRIQSIGTRHYNGQILRSPDTGLKAAKLIYQDTWVPLRNYIILSHPSHRWSWSHCLFCTSWDQHVFNKMTHGNHFHAAELDKRGWVSPRGRCAHL